MADPAAQLKNWSTGAVVAAEKSGCPVVPVAIGGLRLDWSPETVIFSAIEAEGPEPPFRISVRIGKPIVPTIDTHADLEKLRAAVAELMQGIPGLRPAPGESDPAFGKITLRDGRTIAYTDRGPRTGTPVLYFHGFQGSRLERVPGLDEILAKLEIRLISPDRPGIGLSTPVRGRTLLGWADNVRQLTEQVLGPGQPFSILGRSYLCAGLRTTARPARHGAGKRSGAASPDLGMAALFERSMANSAFGEAGVLQGRSLSEDRKEAARSRRQRLGRLLQRRPARPFGGRSENSGAA